MNNLFHLELVGFGGLWLQVGDHGSVRGLRKKVLFGRCKETWGKRVNQQRSVETAAGGRDGDGKAREQLGTKDASRLEAVFEAEVDDGNRLVGRDRECCVRVGLQGPFHFE